MLGSIGALGVDKAYRHRTSSLTPHMMLSSTKKMLISIDTLVIVREVDDEGELHYDGAKVSDEIVVLRCPRAEDDTPDCSVYVRFDVDESALLDHPSLQDESVASVLPLSISLVSFLVYLLFV
jgi:hypothetical protein